MSLPIVLPFGTVAVYGDGVQGSTPQTAMPSGAIIPPNYRYGTVYNIWAGGEAYVYGGDIVYWKEGDQIARVVTSNNLTYSIVPAKLVTIDIEPIIF